MAAAHEDGDTGKAGQVEADEAAEASRTPVVPVHRSRVGVAHEPAQSHLHTGPGGEAGLVGKFQCLA
jgi:hypothetical protein